MVSRSSPPVYIVLLRRPRKNDPRTDPLYEFGSFGLTGCHRRNLLHSRNAPRLNGARLAFVQGGDGGARLICLTPPVTVATHSDHGHGDGVRLEVCWNKDDPAGQFFKYGSALTVTDIGDLAGMIEDVDRSTVQAKLASKFRSRTKPLPPRVAEALVSAHIKASGKAGGFAASYEETLPYLPDIIDKQRELTREKLLLEARDYASASLDSGVGRLGNEEPHTKKRRNKCR